MTDPEKEEFATKILEDTSKYLTDNFNSNFHLKSPTDKILVKALGYAIAEALERRVAQND